MNYTYKFEKQNDVDEQKNLSLEWKTQYKITVGIARRILYLHEDSQHHRDLKASNIRLDRDLNAKIFRFWSRKTIRWKRDSSQYEADLWYFAYQKIVCYMLPTYCKRKISITVSLLLLVLQFANAYILWHAVDTWHQNILSKETSQLNPMHIALNFSFGNYYR